jgi:hypothetical protein
VRPEQNGLQGVRGATAPDGVSQPPTLTHPGIDPGLPQAGVFFHRAVSVLVLIRMHWGRCAIGLGMAMTVSVTAIPNLHARSSY